MKYKNQKLQGFTLVEILVGVLIGGFLLLGAIQFAKSTVYHSTVGKAQTTMDQELTRFQALMITDLERAGNDASGMGVLRAYQALSGVPCALQPFEYGLVEFPSDNECKDVWGVIGILSYQGIDIDRNGIFFPEEGVNFSAPVLRPSSGASGVANPYNDFIVYDWDLATKTVVRKNIGDPNTSEGDSSEVVLRNVARFSVEFLKETNSSDQVKPGFETTRNSGVRVSVAIYDPKVDHDYTNPNYANDSEFYHVRTVERQFVYNVIDSAICVY